MHDQLIENPKPEEEPSLEELIDYEEELQRWMAREDASLLSQMYLASSFIYHEHEEIAISKDSFKKLCDWLATNFLSIPNYFRSCIKRTDVESHTCSLVVVDRGKKPKLGTNFPPGIESLVERLDDMAMIQGSHQQCLDS